MIPGWMSEKELQWLAEQARKHSRIAEIGSWRGRSTRALADNTQGIVYAIDTWTDDAVGFRGDWSATEDKSLYDQRDWLYLEFQKNLADRIKAGVVSPQRMSSSQAASHLKDLKFDMIFIDAGHTFKEVTEDIRTWKPLLEEGGLLCGHDFKHPDCPDVETAVRTLLPNIEVFETIWIAKKNPRYTIITPTTLRPSLIRACESVNNQTCTDWEHIVMVDSEITDDTLTKISHPQRKIFRCDRPHRNWGHTCRYNAYVYATGDYLYYLDDDNYLADNRVLEDLKAVTKQWAIFPIERYGERFFNDPPGLRKTDTGSFIVRRESGRWLDRPDYDTDGKVVEQLLYNFSAYQIIDSRPLMVYGGSPVIEPTMGDRISIFTPVHNITYLREAYESIKDQDFYEWILIFNNGAPPTDFGDPRVKTRVLYKAPEKVGTLKAYACEQATGDILLELDCDDMLMPTAIADIKQAFTDSEVGFVYSNAIHAMGDLSRREHFSESNGWKYRDIDVQGHKLDELISFPPTPESVSRVWFGPDHLRAFRRSVYKQIGGHNPDMHILDDSDIVCRAYLSTTFAHLNKGLYVYRVHGANSWLKFNKDIQDGVYKIYDQYVDRLVDRWADLNGLPKYEIGNPTVSRQGYKKLPLSSQWPLETSSVGVIRSVDTLCGTRDPIAAMKEISRVLVPGGWAFIQVPSTDGRGAFQDPRHVCFWNENSFLYYTNQNWAQYIDTPVRFQSPRLYTTEKNQNQVCWVIAHLINLKDGYRPCGQIFV